jgi:pimeloyl-ACP methyl ester carboxylesterase
MRSALRVASGALGLAPAGPRAAKAEVERLRQCLTAAGSQTAPISYLQSRPSSAGPRFLLVHGTPGSAASWADYLLQPPGSAEVLAIDRPGFGRSGPQQAVPGLAQQAAAVRRLLPAAGRPVVLVGHSFGAPVAAHLAATLALEEPQRPVILALLAAAMDPALEDIHTMQRLGAWAPVRAILPRVIRNANAELLALKPELQALGAMLPRVTARVLIVHGTRDDLVPVANVAYMQSRFQNAASVRTVLLEGRNHFLPWNSEAEIRQALQQTMEAVC